MANNADAPNMVEQMDKVRNIVNTLGWMDEGSFEQGQHIVGELSVEVELLVRAVFAQYPQIKEKADNGEI